MAMVFLVAGGCAASDGFQRALNTAQSLQPTSQTIGVIPPTLSNAGWASSFAREVGVEGFTEQAALVLAGNERIAEGVPNDGLPERMALMEVKDGKACFVYARSPSPMARGDGDDFMQSDLEVVKKRSSFRVEAFESLASLPTRRLVVDGVGAELTAVGVEEISETVTLSSYQWVEGRFTNKMTGTLHAFTLCGSAPPITSDKTHYITVSKTESGYPDGMLFTWEITDQAKPTLPLR